MLVNGYRSMWLIAMFDLPVDSRAARRAYTQFRMHLIRDGFMQLQYSVYARHCSSQENAQVHIKRIDQGVPEAGEVRLLTVTDKQFERMRIFWGKMRRAPEPPSSQLELF